MKFFVFRDVYNGVYTLEVSRFRKPERAMSYLLRLGVVDSASELTYVGKRKKVQCYV